jgi:RNA polymerase sigma factor (sigma-70 family)
MTPAAGTVTDQPDTQHLAERARAGSMDALAALYDAHAAGVYRVAFRLLRSVSDAEDVVQDVFVGLPRALRSYRGEGRLDAWIRQVAARTALMRLRTQRNRREEPAAGDHGQATTPRDLHAVSRTTHPVDRIALRRALDALPEDYRVVFMLKVVEGYAHDEIAALLDITPLASRTRLARARKQLEHQLR